MRGNPNFTGHNPDYRQLPSEFWSREDWAMHERRQQPLPLDVQPVVPPLPRVAAGFTLFPKPRGREPASAQSRAVDRLLEKYVGRCH